MEVLIINNEYLHRHPLWQHCATSLSDISKRDYHGKDYFPNMIIDALDMDSYEKAVHKGNRRNQSCTGDAIVGIALEKSGDMLVHPAVMIVELRMEYKRGDNISLTELTNKVTHTRTLLSTHLLVHHNYYFIFTDHEEPQAKSLLYREAQEIGRMQEYKVTSVSDFNRNMKEPSSIPCTYKYSDMDIMMTFNAYYNEISCDIKKCEAQFYYWINIIEQLKNVYNREEARHIKEVLRNILNQIMKYTLNEDEQFKVEIMIEELNCEGEY